MHSRVRLNERVTVDFEVDMNYGDDAALDGLDTINWSLRVEILGGRRQTQALAAS